ncbi:Twin-arginine translocation pathway signal [Ancylobacter sp. G4_0304]|uniref:Twin-arginine translocation pathway signal n=1 Tax=Ancylobacter sp. G4_0304 TaxID=3114289 RepID=UPI0039C74112
MTTLIDRRGVSRRTLLAGFGAVGALMVSGVAVLSPREAWGLEVANLKPETMRTLIVMARDVYPHDRIPNRYYAIAMKPYETEAADPAAKALIENGVSTLDTLAKGRYGVPYADVGWEEQRTSLLREIEDSAFFQKVRGGLVVSLYNQEEVWPIFGYEGASAEKGGYIDRGFDDIAWL